MSDYQIGVFDAYHRQIDLLPTARLEHLSYELKVNDVSTLTFNLKGGDSLIAYLANKTALDTIFDLYRDNGSGFELEKSFFHRGADSGEDENTGLDIFVSVADSPESLMEARQMVPEDDPVEAGGFITRSGPADQVMMDYVNYQCISPQTPIGVARIIPNFELATFSATYPMTFQRRKHEDKLLTVLKDIANQALIDFWITRVGGKFIFYAGRLGTDRSVTHNYPLNDFVLFSKERGNLRNPRLRWNRQGEITVMYVAGQGNDETRLYIEVPSGRFADSPYNRRENTIDARTDETLDELYAQGNAELVRYKPLQEFTFDVLTNASGGRYNIDWFLGDVVTAQWKGYQADYRVTGVKVDFTEAEETITPILTTPPFGG